MVRVTIVDVDAAAWRLGVETLWLAPDCIEAAFEREDGRTVLILHDRVDGSMPEIVVRESIGLVLGRIAKARRRG